MTFALGLLADIGPYVSWTSSFLSSPELDEDEKFSLPFEFDLLLRALTTDL